MIVHRDVSLPPATLETNYFSVSFLHFGSWDL
jgi:hypothetical protein